MTLRRDILLGLLVPATLLVLVQILRPNDGMELVCIIFAVPVLVLNAWEWTSLDAAEWATLRGQVHPLQWLRERWPVWAAWLRRKSAYLAEAPVAAPARLSGLRHNRTFLRTYGIVMVAAGIVIMAAIFSNLDFNWGKLTLGMVGFLAFTAGLYIIFG